jgi:hypothetical protein
MLDFRPRVRSRNYLSRREQRRLFGWVMGVGLVVLTLALFGQVRDFLQSQSAKAAPSIDTRFKAEQNQSGEPDAVTITSSSASDLSDAGGDAAGIQREHLVQIRDDTPWIRGDELPAWFNLWNVLSRSDKHQLNAESTGKVGFAELFQQPNAFRGKLVTVRGSARRTTYLEAGDNSRGLEGYYRVIVWPEGGPAEPIFVYVLELPKGFPVGEDVRAELQATGFFFKRMVYPAQSEGELRRAPVIMARSVDWLDSAEVTPVSDHASLQLMLGLTVLGIVGLIVAIAWATRDRLHTRPVAKPTIDPIDDQDIVDVRVSLARLAENDQ